MKKSRFSEHQIITILKSVEAGRTARDVCREHGISSATFHGWKSRFGGMEASDIKCMRDCIFINADKNRVASRHGYPTINVAC